MRSEGPEEASEILKRRTLGKVLTEPFCVVFVGNLMLAKVAF